MMMRFLNIVYNFTSNIIVSNIISMTIISIISSNIQNETISDFNNRIIIKLIQHYIYCNKDCYLKKRCEFKFSHLKRKRKKQKKCK